MQRLPAVLRSEGTRERKGQGGSHATGKRGRMLGTAAIVTGRERIVAQIDGERGAEKEERGGGRRREMRGDVWRESKKEKIRMESEEEGEKGVGGRAGRREEKERCRRRDGKGKRWELKIKETKKKRDRNRNGDERTRRKLEFERQITVKQG